MEKQILKVVKIGGKLIEDENKLREFLKDFCALPFPKILVHGGGTMATKLAEKLGYDTKMVDGRRITDANSMKVITMVYGGLINKNIVAKLQAIGTNALGLCGADAGSIVSSKREIKEIDFGFVGDIERVNTSFISSTLQQNITPVFSAISYDGKGELLNTNGDSVAAEIAKAMAGIYDTELYYCFEKKGVLTDVENDESVIEDIDEQLYRQLLNRGIISEGMLPKLQNCFEALNNGVSKIYLGDSNLLKKNAVHTKIVK
ncbi:acetylglutamate kinase [Zunongwangia sp. F363]|uniref:Acetylglutamate kinase n=1 Tax=Autumnicola tepida TaxID=3075595 RepID=A0ABU3CEU3_9FLAO|nr:acetylglutamate kinase [Zunongwangia sp. F363]MDT0644871.1 acetylglutamate kinase [Zunongwangia sp. F363]